MTLGDLTKSWTDSLTTMSVGSLSFVLPLITEIDPDGSVSIAFGKVKTVFQSFEDAGQLTAIMAGILFVGFSLLFGSWLMQFGELLAVLPRRQVGRSKLRKRMKEVAHNPALLMIFQGAYSSFRMFCAFGALGLWFGAFLVAVGLMNWSWQTPLIGLIIGSFGLNSCLIFADWSFGYLDWIISGDLSV